MTSGQNFKTTLIFFTKKFKYHKKAIFRTFIL